MKTVKWRPIIETEIQSILKKMKTGHFRDTLTGSDRIPDESDQASAILDEDLEFMLRDREWVRLKLLQGALSRIEDGSFGICEECKGEIPEKRLILHPVATHCIECQSRAERDLRRSRIAGIIH